MVNKFSILTILIACLVATAIAIDDFEAYVKAFNKTYKNPLEATLRRELFLKSKQFIDKFNEEQAGNGAFKLGFNHLSDLSDEEIKARRGYRAQSAKNGRRSSRTEAAEYFADLSQAVPDSVDWTQVSGRVGPVRDQGQCGCDWAFASVGGIEGQMSTHWKTHKLIPLSVQDLIDCSINNAGCFGGLADGAYYDIQDWGGIEAESTYPYTGQYDLCKFNMSKSVLSIDNYKYIHVGDEEGLKRGVATSGPVAAIMDGSQDSFRHYKGGVYYEPKCKNFQLDNPNSVLIVGYGTDKASGMDYWFIKNSWGTGWGEKGFMRLARNKDNHCGITNLAVLVSL